jgi:hypothetical protein
MWNAVGIAMREAEGIWIVPALLSIVLPTCMVSVISSVKGK